LIVGIAQKPVAKKTSAVKRQANGARILVKKGAVATPIFMNFQGRQGVLGTVALRP
jgi:hypothetical protein